MLFNVFFLSPAIFAASLIISLTINKLSI